jgi:hypothetical protein
MRIRILDVVVLVVCAAGIAFSAAFVYSGNAAEPVVNISSKTGEWIYPLKDSRTVEVEGPLGTTEIVIQGGSARIVESPCPNKTCIAAGAIMRAGQWLACLPNGVFVRIDGSTAKGGVDAATY